MLKKFLSLFGKRYRWISVEDKLPLDGQDVLVHDGESVFIAYAIISPINNKPCWYDAILRSEHLDYQLSGYYVTHWMPKPEIP